MKMPFQGLAGTNFTYFSLQKETPSAQLLHLAALQGNLPLLVSVLDSGKVYVDCKDQEGTTALIIACANNNYDCAKELLEQGANPAAKRVTGTTALFFAAQGGYLDIARLLLEHNAPVDAASVDRATPLFVAAQNGHLNLVSHLIALNADINLKRTDGATALWIASQMGHTAVVAELLAHGAEVDSTRHDGATPLFKAAHKGYAGLVELLVKQGASLGLLKNGESALHAAALFDHLSVIKLLLAAGADPQLRNQDGLTPLDLAHEASNTQIVDYLKQHIATRGLPDSMRAS
ncbi:uncharacterized protein LOC119183120 isoform X3 [Rhipicephalus microplus]|uniref:uncharacterized protein LOC119183120 isoform X3 n=1 Tax=Rhipicephalus microplus TaxID=6941 RepID=UPI00188976DF|nr:ankyrin repeat domain-containing protein 29-like isoform X3 [Rhipicephalus microplus]